MTQTVPLCEVDTTHARAAHTLTLALCSHGCPVLVFIDEDGVAFGQAHIPLAGVEQFIADLREMALYSADALGRP